jgi:hypothetical protein
MNDKTWKQGSVKIKFGQVNVAGHLSDWTSAFYVKNFHSQEFSMRFISIYGNLFYKFSESMLYGDGGTE